MRRRNGRTAGRFPGTVPCGLYAGRAEGVGGGPSALRLYHRWSIGDAGRAGGDRGDLPEGADRGGHGDAPLCTGPDAAGPGGGGRAVLDDDGRNLLAAADGRFSGCGHRGAAAADRCAAGRVGAHARRSDDGDAAGEDAGGAAAGRAAAGVRGAFNF